MASFRLRPAVSSDSASIRSLVRKARLLPIGLDWRRFTLAVDAAGVLIGCGQVKPHYDGSRELASIAVDPAWRRQGVARAFISDLIEQNPGTLYLTCRTSLIPFYDKFGFQEAQLENLPPYFRRIKRLARLVGRIRADIWTVMKKEGDSAGG